ncbi:MAG: glycosyltransferase [Clostridia bacterium]|nr:glycosyltransferase [Clostridia bacterium]
MNRPKISIIIPIYNAERDLDRCMASVFMQTFSEYEVILVDDGSTDRSGAIADAYERRDPRVRVLHQQNCGAGAARNAGLALAQGTYLAFLDADDWFAPNLLSALYEKAVEGDYDLVLCGMDFYRQTESGPVCIRTVDCPETVCCTREECLQSIALFCPTTPLFNVSWNKLYRRSVLERNGLSYPDQRRAEDAIFNLEYFDCITSLASVPSVLYHYRVSTPIEDLRKTSKDQIACDIAYYSRVIEKMQAWGAYTGALKLRCDSCYVNQVYETIQNYDAPHWGLSAKERRQYLRDALNRPELEAFLPTATVQPELYERYTQLLRKDEARIVRTHRTEAFKARVRKIRPLIGLYRRLRGPDA